MASLDSEERKKYDESLRAYRDTIVVMEGQFLEGERKGREEGRAEGREEGEHAKVTFPDSTDMEVPVRSLFYHALVLQLCDKACDVTVGDVWGDVVFLTKCFFERRNSEVALALGLLPQPCGTLAECQKAVKIDIGHSFGHDNRVSAYFAEHKSFFQFHN